MIDSFLRAAAIFGGLYLFVAALGASIAFLAHAWFLPWVERTARASGDENAAVKIAFVRSVHPAPLTWPQAFVISLRWPWTFAGGLRTFLVGYRFGRRGHVVSDKKDSK